MSLAESFNMFAMIDQLTPGAMQRAEAAWHLTWHRLPNVVNASLHSAVLATGLRAPAGTRCTTGFSFRSAPPSALFLRHLRMPGVIEVTAVLTGKQSII